MGEKISPSVRQKVAERAEFQCEYCLTPQKLSGAQMHVEHYLPRSQGGTSNLENLCYACAWCNSYKGDKTSAFDSLTGKNIRIFNPRTQIWREHFQWSQDEIQVIGITDVGRATVEALKMNNPFILPSRRFWVQAGWKAK